jgi:hypothetical protein
MNTDYVFPFGQPLHAVQQQDRNPKKVFVLGVYASAVHARWYSPEDKLLCQALAVASEPYIFWRGDNAAGIIGKIAIPKEAGCLREADPQFNGPSGKTLDAKYLTPLGYSRDDAWLCDLVPHSYQNENQQKAIQEHYNPLRQTLGLPEATIPVRPRLLIDDNRRAEILQELAESRATTIILLGDDPIQWFLSRVSDCTKTRLEEFGAEHYGDPAGVTIAGKPYTVIPLTHPRQADGLGSHSPKWESLHEEWVQRRITK